MSPLCSGLAALAAVASLTLTGCGEPALSDGMAYSLGYVLAEGHPEIQLADCLSVAEKAHRDGAIVEAQQALVFGGCMEGGAGMPPAYPAEVERGRAVAAS